jgi:hypothetical protein
MAKHAMDHHKTQKRPLNQVSPFAIYKFLWIKKECNRTLAFSEEN